MNVATEVNSPEVACEKCRNPIGADVPLYCKNCGRQWHVACFTIAKLCPKCATPLATKAAHEDAKAKLEDSMGRLVKRVTLFLLFANALTIATWNVSQLFANLSNLGRVTALPGATATQLGLLFTSAAFALLFAKINHGKLALMGVICASAAYFNSALGFGIDPFDLGRALNGLKMVFYFSPVACIITALYALNDWRQVSAALRKKRL